MWTEDRELSSGDRDLVCRLRVTAILSVENVLMTHGTMRYFHSDMAAFFMRQGSLILRVQLLLSVFSVLFLLTSPMAHLWHLQSEYADPDTKSDMAWQTPGLHADTHVLMGASAKTPKNQHDLMSCWVCQLFSYTQHALYVQPLVLMAVAITFGCIFCPTSTFYVLSHPCSDSRAPPTCVS